MFVLLGLCFLCFNAYVYDSYVHLFKNPNS